MAETLLTKKIKLALYRYTKAHLLGVYGVFECVMGANTVGYGNERVDFLTMDSGSEFRCYEVKVSKEDLNSTANLSFYGDYNYLVVPEDLQDEALEFIIGRYKERVGLLVYYKNGEIRSKWKCEKNKLRIEQRIANMYNMVRSGSRYTTKWVKQQEESPGAGINCDPVLFDDDFPVLGIYNGSV